MIPPEALISSLAMRSESRTVCSLIAIAPEVELRRPSFTESPVTQVSVDPPGAAVPPLPVAVVDVSLLHPANSNATTAIAAAVKTADLVFPRPIGSDSLSCK